MIGRNDHLWRFQSTPPMQGATAQTDGIMRPMWFQSTPPMQGATIRMDFAPDLLKFQSTPPMQGATVIDDHKYVVFILVSIHAPYAGSDKAPEKRPLTSAEFQSTPPMQGATLWEL